MKKAFLVILIFLLSFIYKVSAQSTESIQSFNSYININKDGTIDVTEQIKYNFGTNQKHGIYRNIPIIKTNQEGKRFKLSIENISATDQNKIPYTVSVESSGDYKKIKIGDANKFVTGLKDYYISYKISGAITYFSDHDELYWNVTGNEWDVPIESALSTVYLAGGSDADKITTTCFTGLKGESKRDCEIKNAGANTNFSTLTSLSPKEGITIVYGFPKGKISVLEPKKDNSGIISLIIFSIIGLVYLYWTLVYPIRIFIKWYKDRRHTKKEQRIVTAWFSSPKTLDKRTMRPVEVGALIDKSVDHQDFTATIIDLAERGYLKITSLDKEDKFSFQKKKDFLDDKNLVSFEKEAMEILFGTSDETTLDELKSSLTLPKKIEDFKKGVMRCLTLENKLFEEDPYKVSMFYSIISVFAFITLSFPLAIIALLFGRKSARRSDLGIEKYSEAYSLRNFLISQDEQLNFQAQNQMFFEKLLPYATAFGVEKIWAKRFADLKLKPTDWYEGNLNNVTSYILISSALNSSVAHTVSSSSSSSGFSSGFSGGSSGGGGGGGGSW
jgi:uncharacterized membrane protein